MLNQLLNIPQTEYKVYKNIHHTLSRHAAFQINKWKKKDKIKCLLILTIYTNKFAAKSI
jgi:hypothetical protein